MKIPLLSSLIAQHARRKLRCSLRGYRKLVETNQLDKVARVKDGFVHSKLHLGIDASYLIFGAATPKAEISVRQFLLARLGGIDLVQAILRAAGTDNNKFMMPLPLEWRNIVANHGFNVAPIRSRVVWATYVTLHLIYGVAIFLKRLFLCLKNTIYSPSPNIGKFVYFDNLNKNTLPESNVKGISYDIMTWYSMQTSSDEKIDVYCHDVKNVSPILIGCKKVISQKGPVPELDQFLPLLKFFLWGVAASLKAFCDFLCGNWVSALMLGESVKAAQARFLEPSRLAREYLFHNSNFVFRPLWTYEAEQLGSKIALYFYSANCESFKRNKGYTRYTNDYYEVMNWPYYLAWDNYQADFIRRSVGELAKIEVVGPIWFGSSSEDLPSLTTSRNVAIFDVQPVRTSYYQRLGIDFDYYTPKNVNSFLVDSHAATLACGGVAVHKRKREIGLLIHPAYASCIKKLSQAKGFVATDANVSAFRLIEMCVAVISMPFTSTALIGQALGKPSAYYDPHGMIQHDDRAAHGIPILCGPIELRLWLTQVMKLDDTSKDWSRN
jgi:polysaccharide biosynthesis PFTS motif protein